MHNTYYDVIKLGFCPWPNLKSVNKKAEFLK